MNSNLIKALVVDTFFHSRLGGDLDWREQLEAGRQ